MIYERVKTELVIAGLMLLICSCAQQNPTQGAYNPQLEEYQAQTSQIIGHMSQMMAQANAGSRGIVSYGGSSNSPASASAQASSFQAAAQACLKGVSSIQPAAGKAWSDMGTQLVGCFGQLVQGQGAVMGPAYHNLTSGTQSQYVQVLNGGQAVTGSTQSNMHSLTSSGWDN